MRKLAEFIVDKRKFLLIIFIAAAIGSVIMSSHINVIQELTDYLPDDTDHDPIQGIRMRDKVSRDVAEWIFQMGITVNHIQMKKDAAKERGTSQTD